MLTKHFGKFLQKYFRFMKYSQTTPNKNIQPKFKPKQTFFLKKIAPLALIVCFAHNLAYAGDEPQELMIDPNIRQSTAKISKNTQALEVKRPAIAAYAQAKPIDSMNSKSAAIQNPETTKLPEIPETVALSSDATIDLINLDKTDLNRSFTSADSSLWQRIRGGFAMPELNDAPTQEKTQWYADRPEYFSRINDRASKYLYYIVQEVEKRNLPLELALLPIVESAFNPTAKSSAKASGMWQFMPLTGKDFNLQQNLFVDERRDIVSSTQAALDYLTRLHKQFGDWHLALAAYNWGEGSVAKAIRKNESIGLPTDYLSLSMPQETRYYVPKLQAIKNIIKSPQNYGINLIDIPNHPYFVTVTTSKDVDVDLAAQMANMTISEFKALNPSFNKPVIIGATKPQILLPWDKAQTFQANLASNTKPSSVTAIMVPKRMRIHELADNYGVSTSQIMELNQISKAFRFSAGSTVLLPKLPHLNNDISLNIAEKGKLLTEKDLPDTRKVNVYIGKRDTWQSIAERYNVSAESLKSWNTGVESLKASRALALVLPYQQSFNINPNPPVEVSKPTKLATKPNKASKTDKKDDIKLADRKTKRINDLDELDKHTKLAKNHKDNKDSDIKPKVLMVNGKKIVNVSPKKLKVSVLPKATTVSKEVKKRT